MPSALATYVLIVVLFSVPLLIYFERTELTTWTNPLLFASFTPELSRHTPNVTEGTYLPPILTTSQTFGPDSGPIIITKRTLVNPGVTLTLAPGTQLFFNEFASLSIEGTLRAVGSANAPINLQSNERHVSNQVWGGIAFAPQASGELTNVRILDASPGITCEARSRVVARHVTILRGSLGFFNASATCQLFDSIINSNHDGVVVVDAAPTLDRSTSIQAPHVLVTRPTATP